MQRLSWQLNEYELVTPKHIFDFNFITDSDSDTDRVEILCRVGSFHILGGRE